MARRNPVIPGDRETSRSGTYPHCPHGLRFYAGRTRAIFSCGVAPDQVRGMSPVDDLQLDPVAPAPRGTARLVVRTAAPERHVAALVTGGYVVDDLAVVDTDLETAFLRLTRSDHLEGAS